MTLRPSRRALLAVATGSMVLGGLAVPALAAPGALDGSVVGTESETVCVYTRNDPTTGERDGLCVWVPDVLPPTPPLSAR